MQLEIAISDETIEKLAESIASKIVLNGGGAAAAAEEDDFGAEAEPEVEEITLTAMQDAIKAAVGKHGKDKIKAVVKKIAGVEKVIEIPKEKYQAVLDGLKKVK